MSGYELPAVDVITFGAPCQDISIAGTRAGMKHEERGDAETTRSGLFFEAIRIIKEMRDRERNFGRTGEHGRPRYAVYENVPGAFSSNGGKDFQAVLTEIVRVADPEAPDVPLPVQGGWTKSGCLYSELGTWSVAWRQHDARDFGVPQRRKRIAVVADFAGVSAPEILFDYQLRGDPEGCFANDVEQRSGEYSRSKICPVSESLQRHSCEGGEAWKSASAGTGRGASGAEGCRTYDARGNGDGETVCTITGDHNNRVTDYTALVLPFDTTQITSPMNYSHPKPGDPCHPLAATAHPPAIAFKQGNGPKARGIGAEVECAPSLVAAESGTNMVPAVCVGNGQLHNISMLDTANTLDTMHDAQAVMISNPDAPNLVRRLTPVECERLQNFPDNWSRYGVNESGKVYELSDSARYKLQGNSIARPFWTWLLRRIAAQYDRKMTLGSLFAGQGGFELCAEEVGALPLWSSEIEVHAQSVLRYHWPEDDNESKRL